MMSGMRYLHNVSTLNLFQERCTGCGMCQIVCPHEVFRVNGGLAAILDRDACMECGACSRNCPAEAIAVEAGVGCAQAVINTALGRRSGSCCTLEDEESPETECSSADTGRRSSGCC